MGIYLGIYPGYLPSKINTRVFYITSYDNEETAVRFLCHCEAYSTYRFEHLDRRLCKPWELHDIPVRCLLNFVSATGLF